MGSTPQGIPSPFKRGDLIKIVETNQIYKVSASDPIGVWVWEGDVEHGKYCFMTDIERVESAQPQTETINFHGITITRRVINANRLDFIEYGLIVYNCLFYRVTRHVGFTMWQVGEALS